MSFFCIPLFRGAFNEGVTKARLDPLERDNIREKYSQYISLKSILDQAIIGTVYVSYDSKFYVDSVGYEEIAVATFKKFGIQIEPIYHSVDIECVAIENYPSFCTVIQKSHRFLNTPEALAKRKEISIAKQKAQQDARGLQIKLSGQLPSSIENCNLLVIDFEFCHHKNNLVFECGITTSFNGKVVHEHYLIDEHYKDKKNYDLQFKFNFGKTHIISMDELVVILDRFLKDADYFVGHCLLSEYLVLKEHGLNIFDYKQLKCMDTQFLFKDKFKPEPAYNNLSLINLLALFQIDHVNLHNAGNDSAYTMMVLMKILETHESPFNSANNIVLTSKRYRTISPLVN